MPRGGQYVTQPSDYKAFIPSPLPPDPPLALSDKTGDLMQQASRGLSNLDQLADALPNATLFLSMYVRKEALLSSQIEGTQATMEEVLIYGSYEEVDSFDDVGEVVNYVTALDYGIARISDFPLNVRVILELHRILLSGVRGQERTPGEFRRS